MNVALPHPNLKLRLWTVPLCPSWNDRYHLGGQRPVIKQAVRDWEEDAYARLIEQGWETPAFTLWVLLAKAYMPVSRDLDKVIPTLADLLKRPQLVGSDDRYLMDVMAEKFPTRDRTLHRIEFGLTEYVSG